MLKEMLEKKPKDAFLHHAIGMEHLGGQDVELAMQFFQKAIQLDSSFTASFYKLTECLMHIEQWDDALETAKTGFQLAESKNDGKSMFEFEDLIDQIEDNV